MFAGPVFTREVVTAPRRARFFVSRAVYVSVLLILVCTAWLILAGTQTIRGAGEYARFGAILFQILAPLQLALAFFFSAVLAASAVAQEKDRQTLVMLLLTHLSNSELVLGKLLASMLLVLVLLASAAPLFVLCMLFGGVGFDQIARVFAVTTASVLAAGSFGSTIALWREKTYQSLSLTLLCLVVWLGLGEAIARGVGGQFWQGAPTASWAAGISPWQAILAAARPGAAHARLPGVGDPIVMFSFVSLSLALLLNGAAVALVRVWNPSREARAGRGAEAGDETIWGAEHDAASSPIALEARRSAHAAPGARREVWDNPVLWREIRTWAYGKRILLTKLAYVALFVASAWSLSGAINDARGLTQAAGALALAPLFLLSLTLINAQAVTALTSERDGRALDLLLVTDLTPQEFIFGKLGGVLFNTKEMVLLPLGLLIYAWWREGLTAENTTYLALGQLVMIVFVAVLGMHVGMIHANSRTAIAVSLGTVFFLFVGIATCMRMMVAFSGSFQLQLQPFLAFMLGGGVGLYLAIGERNPSPAIRLASFVCPFATLWAITSFLLHYTLGVFLVTTLTYGFATAAMLVPALFEFDIATGRTTAADETPPT